MTRLLETLGRQQRIERVLLLDDGTPLGAARTNLFAEIAEAKGVQITDRISLGPEMTAEQLSQRIASGEPDLVYFGGNAGTLRGMLSALEGRPWLLAGGAELADRGFESLSKDVTEGMLFPYPVTAPPPSFTTRFESVLGKPTAGLSAYGYDSTMLILEALIDWGREHPGQVPDGAALYERMSQRLRYQGVTGRITFRANGENAEAAIPIYRWSNGALQQVSKS
jgi:branched-chain amino acid transport system substrate-binding protein